MDILGVDIGGTFTDFVLLRDGRLSIHKILSTPDDPARALLQGVAALGPPAALVHGTTVATNALLERRGAPTALIATAGFGDVLAIGRGERPALYDLDVARPAALVPDRWRVEVDERTLFTGAIQRPLDPADLERVVAWLAEQPVEAVAVCLLHSYANPAHEQAVVEALSVQTLERSNAQRFFVSASHRVLPEQREYERTSTTVINAYVGPALDRYLANLGAALEGQGVGSLRIMASDGGSMGLATARELPARATLSGPAAGVVGAGFVARSAGIERIITFDMGGTSTDVALCEGRLPQTGESHVGGLPVRLPSLDIHTVGAGGGSLARIDAGGALRVGPASAGANPGPACYGRGTEPTVTDANLLLGRLQPNFFLGGRMRLDVERARAAFLPLAQGLFKDDARLPTDTRGMIDNESIRENPHDPRIELADLQKEDPRLPTDTRGMIDYESIRENPHDPRIELADLQKDDPRLPTDTRGLTDLEPIPPDPRIELAALGVVRVANAAMERAIRAVSVERGDDPRDYTLVAFGGAGPLHAAHLAESLGLRQVLVPRYPGVLSALGMLVADVTRDGSQALLCPLGELDPADLDRRMRALAEAGLAALLADGEPPERCQVEFALDLRYRGQSFEISTPLMADPAARPAPESPWLPDLAAVAARFHALHERRYGHALPDRPIEAVLLRARAISRRPPLVADHTAAQPARPGPLAPRATVPAALESDSATPTPAALYERDDMREGDTFAGPAIVVQLDATTIIPAGWCAVVDPALHLLLSRA